MNMIRIALVGALILAVGTTSAVASIVLSHATLTRTSVLEFKKAGEDASKLTPAPLKILNAREWSAWWQA
jgi:hypothetical protein